MAFSGAWRLIEPLVGAEITRGEIKYDRYDSNIVGSVVSAQAVASTLRLVPRTR